MKIEFKLYAEEDRIDVLEMMTEFNDIDDYDFDQKTGEENLNEFTSNEALGRLYMIRYDQLNVGYIVLTFGYSFEYKGRDAFIDEFFVRENNRNQGIGNLTMDFIASESKKFNIKAIHLEVEPHNEHANKLYLNKGYEIGNRKLMTKRIESHSKH